MIDFKNLGDAADKMKKNPLAWGLLFAGMIIGVQYSDSRDEKKDRKEDQAEIRRLNNRIQFSDSMNAVKIDFIYARFMPVMDSAISYMYKRAAR